MSLFEETVRWKILSLFFAKPEREFYVKELARRLKISPGSSSRECKKLARGGILKASKKGNSLFYSLINANPLVKRLKSAWLLEKLLRFRKLFEDEEFQSVALFGSCASGEFTSKSDIDLLIVTNANPQKTAELSGEIGRIAGREVSALTLPLSRWSDMARGKERIYIEIISNSILLYGAPVV